MNARWFGPGTNEPRSSEHKGETIDLRKMVVTLRKRKWTILFVAVVVAVVATLAVSVATPIYSSSVTMLFANTQADTEFESQTFQLKNGKNGGGVNITTQKEILQSRGMAERVAIEQNLLSHWEFNADIPVPKQYQSQGILPFLRDTAIKKFSFRPGTRGSGSVNIASTLLSKIRVAEPRKTDLLRVTVESADPFLAARIANGYSSALKRYYLEQSSARDGEAETFLAKKVEELKGKLDTSERQLSLELQRIGLSANGVDTSGQTISLLQNRLVDAKARLELARIQWQQVRSVGTSLDDSASVTFTEYRGAQSQADQLYAFIGTNLEFLPIVDSDALVQSHKARVQEAQRELEELSNRYGEKHPRVIDARSSLDTNKQNLDRQIGNVISSIESEFEVTRRQVESLEADIQREEARQFDRSAGRASIKEIELERDVNKRYYEDALLEYRSYQEKELRTVPMSISDRAVPADFPSKPKKAEIVLLSVFVSAISVIILIFMYERLRETVQGIADLERKLGFPVYGVIPYIRSGIFGLGNTPLIPGQTGSKKAGFDEAIWTIHTSATASEPDKDNQVLLITSSIPGEGKSTLALNLAHSMSDLEEVILVEADIRRPGVSKALGLDGGGLTEYLRDEIDLDEAIIEQATGLLDIMPAGGGSNLPGRLLASSAFEDLIVELKRRYKRIVLDLAPVHAVSDAIVVGKHADATIYVVQADSIPIPIVKRGIKRLNDKKISVDGIVISQVDFRRISSYGGDYYYQGYYDCYGYGTNRKQIRSS